MSSVSLLGWWAALWTVWSLWHHGGVRSLKLNYKWRYKSSRLTGLNWTLPVHVNEALSLSVGWRFAVGRLCFWWKASDWEPSWISQRVCRPRVLHGLDPAGNTHTLSSNYAAMMFPVKAVHYRVCVCFRAPWEVILWTSASLCPCTAVPSVSAWWQTCSCRVPEIMTHGSRAERRSSSNSSNTHTHTIHLYDRTTCFWMVFGWTWWCFCHDRCTKAAGRL